MITIQQFLDIKEMDIKDPDYDFNVIKMVFDISFEDVLELTVDELRIKQKKIQQWMQIRKVSNDFIWENTNLIFEIKENIKFGEYIDLEQYLKNDDFDNFLKIFFNVNISFLSAPVTILFNAIDVFNSFQKTIFEAYENLFNFNEEEDKDDEERFISPKRQAINSKEQQMAAKQKHYGWMVPAFQLAKNDITKLNDVLETPFIMILNILSMIKDLKIELNPNSYIPEV